MNYVNVENIGKVSAVAYGTATLGTAIDRENSFKLLDCFVENGGNLIDTAHVYADWLSEEKAVSEKTIGLWMKERRNRDKIFVSTKGAHPLRLNGQYISRLKRNNIEEDINGSLEKLQTEYVDLYFLHRDDKTLPVEEIMETLRDIVKTGKARSIGLSNWCPERIKAAMAYCKEKGYPEISVNQLQFGIAHPNPEGIDPTTEYMTEEAYEFHKETKMPVFSFSSQSAGYFFRKDENGKPLYDKSFDNPMSREKFGLVYKMSEKYNRSVARILISALCGNKDFITIPIIGGLKEQEIIDSLSGTDLKMSQADIDALLKR